VRKPGHEKDDQVFRFLFGTGWWIAWHLAVYLILMFGVALPLLAFGGDLKKPGQQPDLPSLGSIIFVMIPLSIGLVTLVNLLLASPVLTQGIVLRVMLTLIATAAIVLVTGKIAWWLASAQSYAAFYTNVVIAVLMLLGNLTLMHLARRPATPPPLSTSATVTVDRPA
jgi:hypothetical protein